MVAQLLINEEEEDQGHIGKTELQYYKVNRFKVRCLVVIS